MAEPEGDDGGQGEGSEEGVSGAVVAGGNASPVLEAAEHDFDAVALLAEVGVVGDRHLAVFVVAQESHPVRLLRLTKPESYSRPTRLRRCLPLSASTVSFLKASQPNAYATTSALLTKTLTHDTSSSLFCANTA